MSRRGWVLFCAMSVIWGIPYLLIRVAVRDLSPPELVFARTAPAALVLLPLALRGRHLRPLLARWYWVVLYTVVELAIPWLMLSRAEQRLTSSTTALLIATVPLLSAVIVLLTGGDDRLDLRRAAGLVLGLVGVAALVGVNMRGDPLPVAEVLVAALGYAVGPQLISRPLAGLPPIGVVTASVTLTAVIYAPWSVTRLPQHVSAEVVAAVAVLAFVCTALAFVLFFALIAEVGPARSTVITYVNPAVALLLGVAILGEPFTVGLALGFPLILLGSILATGHAQRGRSPAVAEP